MSAKCRLLKKCFQTEGHYVLQISAEKISNLLEMKKMIIVAVWQKKIPFDMEPILFNLFIL